jgi:hypothetical protein
MQPWGSPEEVYRRYCYLALAHRFLYYVENAPVLQDHEYDLMERYLIHLESTTGVSHPQSPTKVVGSSDREDYPRTSIEWAGMIMKGAVQRSVYFIEHLVNENWKNYLNSLRPAR